jgi:hypothetical protein
MNAEPVRLGLIAVGLIALLVGWLIQMGMHFAGRTDAGLRYGWRGFLICAPCLVLSWLIVTPLDVAFVQATPYLWFFFVAGLAIGGVFYSRQLLAGFDSVMGRVWRIRPRGEMKAFATKALPVVAVFIVAMFVSRSWFDLRDTDSVIFAAAATFLAVFLYQRLAKRFNL